MDHKMHTKELLDPRKCNRIILCTLVTSMSKLIKAYTVSPDYPPVHTRSIDVSSSG